MGIRKMTLATTFAAGLLLTACDRLPFGSGDPAATEPSASDVAAAPVEPPVATLGTELTLTLECAALSSSEGIVREITLTGGDGVYIHERGDKEARRYEYWKLEVIEPTAFTVTGEYIEGGNGNLKKIEFEGVIDGASLSGEGKRGPRVCTIKS